MKKIINKNFHLTLIALLILVVGYWYLNAVNSLKDLLKRPKYTMALTISDWHHKNTTGISVDYEYFVNKKNTLIQ